MSNLVLDTNILHQEGLHSHNMQLLMRLSSEGHVNIYIPELVKREYLSKKISESIGKIQDAQHKVLYITKKIKRESSLQTHALEAQRNLRNIESILETEITREFDSWVANYNIVVIPIDNTCLNSVIDDYFLGQGVYRKEKSREDIPDAIINSSIMTLLHEKFTLTIILKDGAFKSHLSTIRGITIHDSVNEFIAREENKAKLDELDSLYEKVDSIKECLSSDNISTTIRDYLIANRTDVEDIYLEDEQITSLENLEITTFGQNINYPEPESIGDFNISNIAWLTEGTFSFEVEFSTIATINYGAYYGEYIEIEEDFERETSLDSMNGDGACDISEVRSMKFTGYLQLHIDGDLDPDNINTHINTIGEDHNPIQISLDIEYADIQ